ncbi:MAG: hypothetical protein J5828_00575 [Desulfovibrionaceae bacterium]|nr:hypothetical protein [Desulfovibrionaceae bacterium]
MEKVWSQAFKKSPFPFLGERGGIVQSEISTLGQFKQFLDLVHIRQCLLRPFFEKPEYPLVENRDLIPPFEVELWEYKDLPGFSLVAFDRPLESFNEVFQYDILEPFQNSAQRAEGGAPQDSQVSLRNVQTIAQRLPKKVQASFREAFRRYDVTSLGQYERMLPYLLNMDRAQVFSQTASGNFCMTGVFASFPSDFDGELKRFGMQIGKFRMGDNAMYEQNRQFVYQFLMELYGFPMASERRTSSAVFSRRLHKYGEHFIVRTLGQSDRIISTIWNDGTLARRYPQVEKVALVSIDADRGDLLSTLSQGGWLVDEERRVIILRVRYKQHSFSAANVRQDRALSVAAQELIHPVTGETLQNVSIFRDSSTILLHLNDIVRGEYLGKTIYNRSEVVEHTDTVEKRFKVLHAWLHKNQRRVIGYSEEFYNGVVRVLDDYMHTAEVMEAGPELAELRRSLRSAYAYIRQARRLHELSAIASRQFKGERLTYLQMLNKSVALLHDLKFDLGNYFDRLMESLIKTVEGMLDDRYLRRVYVEREESALSARGRKIRKAYNRLVGLLDEFKAIRKNRRSGAANDTARR